MRLFPPRFGRESLRQSTLLLRVDTKGKLHNARKMAKLQQSQLRMLKRRTGVKTFHYRLIHRKVIQEKRILTNAFTL